VIECPKCGYLNQDGSEFCQNPKACGTFIGYEPRKAPLPPGGVLLTVSPPTVAVAPGAEATVEVRVKNKSQVVDQYEIKVAGEPARWTVAEPSTLSLFPDAEGEVTIRFRPIRSPEVPAGRKLFSIVVQSKAAATISAYQDGSVDVAPFKQASLAVVPRTARGGTSASYRITIQNQGNMPLQAGLEGIDPDDLLTFTFDRPTVSVAPGGSAFVQLTVQPRATFYDGPPQPHMFKLQLSGDGLAPVTTDATMLQEPVPRPVPRKFPLVPVLLALLAVLLLGSAAFAREPIGKLVGQVIGGQPTAAPTASTANSPVASTSSQSPSPVALMLPIPNIRCMTAQPAQQAIEAAGFKFVGRFERSQSFPLGTAFATQPTGQAPKGSEVTALISSGPDTNSPVGLNACKLIIKQLSPDILQRLQQVVPTASP
jgi:hypothetical protein